MELRENKGREKRKEDVSGWLFDKCYWVILWLVHGCRWVVIAI